MVARSVVVDAAVVKRGGGRYVSGHLMKNVSKNLPRILVVIAFFLAVTLLIKPWRDSVSQDDGAYAFSAIHYAHGIFEPHESNASSMWVQSILGAVSVRGFSTLSGLSVLNTVSWVVFLGVILVFSALTRVPLLLLGTYFSYPFWIQYGASFLSDVYSALLLLGVIVFYFSTFFNAPQGSEKLRNGALCFLCAFLVSALLTLQLQYLCVFPILWGTVALLKKECRREFVSLMKSSGLILGGFFAYFSLKFFPQSLLQRNYFEWLSWTVRSIARRGHYPGLLGVIFIELWLAVGLFLIPFLNLKRLKKSQILAGISAHFSLFFLLLWGPAEPLSAGVLFTDYLPRGVGAFLGSLGVWGFFALPRLKKKSEDFVFYLGSLCAVSVIMGFNSLRAAGDLRFGMLMSLPFVILIVRHTKREATLGLEQAFRPFLGNRISVFVPLLIVSLVTNLYNLNTTEMRWKIAQELETKGVLPQEISAGYGRDLFTLENGCIRKETHRIETLPSSERTHAPGGAFYQMMIQFPRLYSDGWISKYLIKPTQVFGRTISLKKNRQVGQDGVPAQVYDYSVLGLPNQMGVFIQEKSQLARCYRTQN